MDAFEYAVGKLLEHEGGYVFDPDDPGGETKYGISKRSYPHLDIKDLTREQAKAIYRRDWWDEYGYHRIQDARVAAKVMDLAVNLGPARAHRLLQQALNDAGCDLDVDGWLGPGTVAAVNRHPVPLLVLACLKLCAVEHYAGLAGEKRFRKYLRGWVLRAVDG